MPVEDNPTGVAYLKTFQALFQLVEIIALMVTWSLVASQTFYKVQALTFAVGVLVFIWLATVFFFTMYVTGFNQKLNEFCGRVRRRMRGGGESSEANTDVVWYVVEYCIYLLLDIFLMIAAIIVSAFATTSPYIAATAFGWFSFLVYTIHFSLLVKTTEGVWPHTLAASCYARASGRRNASENQGLLTSQPPEHSTEP